MKLLVLATNYPSDKNISALNYIHTRNLYYKRYGIDVDVLNFTAKSSYFWDGIRVLTLSDYKSENKNYDIMLSHAPNIRNHFFFCKKYQKRFQNIIFFFHGHEVLWKRKTYSQPYFFIKKNRLKQFGGDVYDFIKLKIWRKYFPKLSYKSYFVFVSNWMLDQFKKWVKLKESDLKNHCFVTYNGIGEDFENVQVQQKKYKYDFITIRSVLDGSKYAIDLVCRLASHYPELSVLIVGRGNYFKYNLKPDNVIWMDCYCNHKQILNLISEASCALMPTRTDAQGLMACEIASTGMPLITSDISVCHEIFKKFNNVKFISNEYPENSFLDIYKNIIKENYNINSTYYLANTTKKEVELFKVIWEK